MSTKDTRSATQPVRALVLSGGGGRGAYEAGVAKACAERDFHFDWIVGTSIGALNAALVGQNDLEMLESMWLKIRSNDVYKLPDPGHLRRVIFGQQLGLLNTAPLEQLLRSCISLERLKTGPSKVGFVTTDLCGLRTKVITSDEIHSQEDLIDVLMASSAIPLLFPPRSLKGEGCWIDGGLVRNTPIQAAINLGATEIYAVLVEPKSVDTCPTSITQLVSRLLEIVFDHSARSGIAHVKQHNRILDVGGLKNSANGNWCLLEDRVDNNGNDKKQRRKKINQAETTTDCGENSRCTRGKIDKAFELIDLTAGVLQRRVSLFIVKPERQILGSLLEIDPVISRWLLKLGYEDILNKCEAAVF